MKTEWLSVLNISSPLDLGDIHDKNKMDLYCITDSIQECIDEITVYFNDRNNYLPMLIGGDAGIGKTTFIHYIYHKVVNKKNQHMIILNKDHDSTNKHVYEVLYNELVKYFQLLLATINLSNLSTDHALRQIKLEKTITKNIDHYKKSKELLDLHNEICQDVNFRNRSDYIDLIIAVDQIDIFNYRDQIKYFEQLLLLLQRSKYVVICFSARKETIELSKMNTKDFFATYFRRHIQLERTPIEKIIIKRIKSKSNDNSKVYLEKYFNKTLVIFLSKLANYNVRLMLDNFRSIISNLMPSTDVENFEKQVVNLLLNKGFIDNLFTNINLRDSIPIYKIVLEAMQYYSKYDAKFERVIRTKVDITISESDLRNKKEMINNTNLTSDNIKQAIEYLCSNHFMHDSLCIKNKYEITEKGEVYLQLLNNTQYQNYFCKDKSKHIFKTNIFTPIDFYK